MLIGLALFLKLAATETNALIADYNYLADEGEFRLIQSAIRLSVTRQFAGQLTGRLLGNTSTAIQALHAARQVLAATGRDRGFGAELGSAGGSRC
jgi:hypothetical protein